MDPPTFVPAPVRSAIMFTLIVALFVDGLINPIVEELYFRGHLLPRLAWLGWLAPVVNAFLLAAQHYWQPYNFPLIFVIQLAVVSVVSWKRNIYIGMLTHCAANTIGAVMSIVSFAGS
jgi:membrane protease YdiL (CAAX protease family)